MKLGGRRRPCLLCDGIHTPEDRPHMRHDAGSRTSPHMGEPVGRSTGFRSRERRCGQCVELEGCTVEGACPKGVYVNTLSRSVYEPNNRRRKRFQVGRCIKEVRVIGMMRRNTYTAELDNYALDILVKYRDTQIRTLQPL